MLIIDIKENESVDKALKKFKKKFERIGILKELRKRSYFEKPSIRVRTTRLKAIYRRQVQEAEVL